MNHACSCGHFPSEHYEITGPCQDFDDEADRPCNCPRYQWQGDD